MRSLVLQALDEKSILLKGFGRNQKIEAISVDKLPGSILVTSEKTKMSVRIYCIYDDYEFRWVFAIAYNTISKNEHPLNFPIDQSFEKNHTRVEYHFPEDSVITLEGEFSES